MTAIPTKDQINTNAIPKSGGNSVELNTRKLYVPNITYDC